MEDFVEENGFDVFPAEGEEVFESDEGSHEAVPDDNLIIRMGNDIDRLFRKIDNLDKKIYSMKVSSKDNRAAKTFAKDIFKSGLTIGYDDLAERTKASEERLVDIDKRIGSVSGQAEENKEKIEFLSRLTYGMMMIGSVHFLITFFAGLGKTAAFITRTISARRKV